MTGEQVRAIADAMRSAHAGESDGDSVHVKHVADGDRIMIYVHWEGEIYGIAFDIDEFRKGPDAFLGQGGHDWVIRSKRLPKATK